MPTEQEEYQANLEQLVVARTEQLKTCVTNYDVLLRALDAVTKAETLETAKLIAQEAFDNRRM
jgi:hypothetical protein